MGRTREMGRTGERQGVIIINENKKREKLIQRETMRKWRGRMGDEQKSLWRDHKE